MKEKGGSSLLRFYNGSCYSLFQKIYPQFEWDPFQFERVPLHYWKSLENRRNFFDKIGNDLGVKKKNDWGKITIKQVKKLGKTIYYLINIMK